jgi:BNR repeat protein
MRAPDLLVFVAPLGILFGAVQAPTPEAGRPRLLAAPEVLVSRDGDFPHVELMIASNPRRPGNLVGTAITGTRPNGGAATSGYVSFDGGASWKAVPLAEPRAAGAADPQVIFTEAGTALQAALVGLAEETPRSALHVYRSEDGGGSWSRPIDLGGPYDHEQIAVDRTAGAHRDRIYLGALWGYPVYRIGVFRSDDDGRTWAGPVESANGDGELGVNVCPLLVLSDGTLFVPYVDFEFKPERQWGEKTSHLWSVVSTDGGVTFSAPRPIVTVRDPETLPTNFQPFPTFAADTHGPRFRDRIYAAWNVVRDGRPRIVVAWSADRGKTWSDSRPLPAATGGDQFQPALAVNDQSVLATTWYETALDASGEVCRGGCFDEYFSASVDGGVTFLPPVRVSSQRSYRKWRLSTEDRFGNGGDYMGLTADATGAFHPFWADSRSGTFQIYTAVVKVKEPAARRGSEAAPRRKENP